MAAGRPRSQTESIPPRAGAGKVPLAPASFFPHGPRVIRLLRTARHLTLADLARRCGRGVSESVISELETGRRVPSPAVLESLARGLGVDVAVFHLPPEESEARHG